MSKEKKKQTQRVPENAPLSEKEQKVMALLKERFKGRVEHLNDIILIRFIRGFDYFPNPEQKTLETMDKFLGWRAAEKIDGLGSAVLKNSDLFKTEYPCGVHGVGKTGHPIYIDRPGKINVKTLLKNFSLEEIQRFHIQRQEQLQDMQLRLLQQGNEVRYKSIVIIDLEGLGKAHLEKKFRSVIKSCLDIDQTFYPETLFVLFVVNAPLAFKAMWKIVGPWLDPVTRERIFMGKDKLLQYVERAQLPRFLGGTCKCKDGQCLVAPFVAGDSNGSEKEVLPLSNEKEVELDDVEDVSSPGSGPSGKDDLPDDDDDSDK